MPALKNFVAVDWRAGKDRIYFFFKDTNQYSRFDLGDNKVAEGHPKEIKASNWGDFHLHAKNLRFGFTTTGFPSILSPLDFTIGEIDLDIAWLFYYEGDTPMVCRYDQDHDKVSSMHRVKDSKWHQLLPYFDRIVAGTWWEIPHHPFLFRFLMNDGTFLNLEFISYYSNIRHEAITNDSYPGLERYKNRIITAAQNDRAFVDSYYYIFLTNNEYIRYNIQENRAETGPRPVNDHSWPGLLRG